MKEATILPTQVSIGDIKITSGRGPKGETEKAWADAAKKWFIDGAHEDKDELTAKITWLAPNLKDELGHMEFQHVGMKEFTYAKLERGDKVAQFTVNLYAELMKLELKGAGA